ncbi:MAG: alanine racemase [Candidatus Methanofastidiosia archaeon]|jgi:D-serine deaminase-like pyridoxal phosphate-dependent protein
MRNLMVGMDKHEIDTPALLIDLDILEKNIETAAKYYNDKKGAALRPHQKGHRLPIIAKKQLNSGAKGVSMTSLGLAEYYASCGITDILITNEIAGKNKLKRVCALSKHADITVGVDTIENVRTLGALAVKNNTTVNVAVELYMGTGTCGVHIEDAHHVIQKITAVEGITFQGLWWHQGSLADITGWEERRKSHFETLDTVLMLIQTLEDMGITCNLVSGGFTCTWDITPEYKELSNVEVQAGSYVFSDWCMRESEGLDVFDCALTVLTRCISRPTSDEALFDAGMNACSDEHTDNYRRVVGYKIKGIEGITRVKQREELSMAKFDEPNTNIKVGDAVEVIPPHSDTTAKLHNMYFGIRKDTVEVVWPNYGRGLL